MLRVIQDLLLLLQSQLRLLKLLVRLSDLTIDVNATLDVQVYDGFRGNSESHGTGRTGVLAGEDADIGDAFAAEGLDGGRLGGDGVGRSRAVGLNIDCIFISILFFVSGYECLPFALSLREYSAIRERIPLETPSTSS